MTTKARIHVTQTIEVFVDETKFTPQFMAEFRESFYDFKTLTAHMKHLAQLEARGITSQPHIDNHFIEGYGHVADMGIRMRVESMEIEIA